MIIFNDDFLGIKIVYTNNLLIIVKNGEIICREVFLERDEAEDFALEYIAKKTKNINYVKYSLREDESKQLGSMLKSIIG